MTSPLVRRLLCLLGVSLEGATVGHNVWALETTPMTGSAVLSSWRIGLSQLQRVGPGVFRPQQEGHLEKVE